MDRAWASTVHAFQGRTVDNIIAAMEAGRPHLAARLEKATDECVAAPDAVRDIRTDVTAGIDKSPGRDDERERDGHDVSARVRDVERRRGQIRGNRLRYRAGAEV